MIQRCVVIVVCLTNCFSLLTGCSGKPEGPAIDPEVKKAVEAFFDAFTQPTQGKNGLPSLEGAYSQLHDDAKKKQKLTDFNRQWTKWIESKGPGWVTTAEIKSVETMPDSVVVIVHVALGDQMTPQLVQGLPLRLTLRKNGSTWAAYSIEE